uniref:Beta-defensin-like protein 22 n=1 Tax=Anolis carolinensis TaxID=28377 RepID=A0A803TVJ2_ANOCA
MKSTLMLLALAFLVFQIKAEPKTEQEPEPDQDQESEQEPLDISDENYSYDSEVAIQPRNTIFCNAAGARCRSRCLSRERMIGRCNAKKRCCLQYG